MTSYIGRCIACVALMVTLSGASAWAQTGAISGTARDQSGAVLPGVTITATQTATGVVRTTVSNETGSYSLLNLPLGPWRIEATLSGFRTFDYQAELIRKKLAGGQEIGEILRVNAAPGFSQHHTGNAIDIATPGSRPLTEEFEHSPAFRWLTGNAGRFGFSMTYPKDNSAGFIYEPWHWSL